MHFTDMRILILILSLLELISCQPIGTRKPTPDGVEPNCDFSHSPVGDGMWVTKKECALDTLSAPLGFQVLRMGEQKILEKGRCINPMEGDREELLIGQCYARRPEFRSAFRPSLTYEKLLSMGFKPEDIPYVNGAPVPIDASVALPSGHLMSIHTSNTHPSSEHGPEDLTPHPPPTPPSRMDGPAAIHTPPHDYSGSSHTASPSTVPGDLSHLTPNINDQTHRAERPEGTMERDYYCFVGKDGKWYLQELQTDPETGHFYALAPQLLHNSDLRCTPTQDQVHPTIIEPKHEVHNGVLGAGSPAQSVQGDSSTVTEPGVFRGASSPRVKKEPSPSVSGLGSRPQGIRKRSKPVRQVKSPRVPSKL